MFFKKIYEKLDFIIEQQGKNLKEYQKIMEEQARQIEEYQKIVSDIKKHNQEMLETERELNKKIFENQENKIKEYQRIVANIQKTNKYVIEEQARQIKEIKKLNSDTIGYQKTLNEKFLKENVKKTENIIELLSQILLKDLLDQYQGNIQELINQMKK